MSETPKDVYEGSDSQFYRSVVVGKNEDGSDQVDARRVCEECWKDIPRYVDYPHGLVAPNSPADRQKVVCVPCYLAVYQRMAPDAELPVMSTLAHNPPSQA